MYSAALVVMISLFAFGRWVPAVRIRLDRGGTLVALFILQAVLRSWVGMEPRSDVALTAWSLIMLCVSAALYLNRGVPGIPLVLLGVLVNVLVVVVNGGMPIVRTVFDSGTVPSGFYHLASSATQLSWMGDVLPDPTGRWLMSLGDLLLMVGAATAIVAGERRLRDLAEGAG